ncbi:MAG: glycine--tRNA ligase subunit alpha, partial [Fimbriimonadaceae bacterium]|nr:glycine--tRNA ligase subunit alpha [Fimbriimonadaceae bacterium]
LNNQNSFWDGLMWNDTLSYKDVDFEQEMQNCVFNFEVASVDMLKTLFETYESESKRVIETPVFWDRTQQILTTREPEGEFVREGKDPECPIAQALVYPAFELALKCGHVFNVLDARGAVSVTERAAYINRVRARVRACCLAYTEQFRKEASKV